MKVCIQCQEKPTLAKGLCSTCYARKSYQSNKEHKRNVKRNWALNNKEKVTQLKRSNLLKQYGLTLDQYNQMLKSQDFGCAICKRKDSGRPRMINLVVDHNHTTGKVRGLLCSPCNVAIGMVKESIDILNRIKEYLS